ISIMLTILVMICSSIDTKFHETNNSKNILTNVSYYIPSLFSLEYCVNQCVIRNKNHTKKIHECVLECITRKCKLTYPNDEKKQLECTEDIVAYYNRRVFHNKPIKFQRSPVSNQEHKALPPNPK
ncbi:hypothetical protein PIB30_081660, partial [Stylosanthes scabra]|nr:hypothetical protein [Stylosanthes scabra]